MAALENSLQESKMSDHFETVLLIQLYLFCGHILLVLTRQVQYDKQNNIYQLSLNEIEKNNLFSASDRYASVCGRGTDEQRQTRFYGRNLMGIHTYMMLIIHNNFKLNIYCNNRF